MISAPPPSPAISSEDPGTTTIVNQVGLQNTVTRVTNEDDQVNVRNGNPNNKSNTVALTAMDPFQQFHAEIPQPTMPNTSNDPFAHTPRDQAYQLSQEQGNPRLQSTVTPATLPINASEAIAFPQPYQEFVAPNEGNNQQYANAPQQNLAIDFNIPTHHNFSANRDEARFTLAPIPTTTAIPPPFQQTVPCPSDIVPVTTSAKSNHSPRKRKQNLDCQLEDWEKDVEVIRSETARFFYEIKEDKERLLKAKQQMLNSLYSMQ